MPRAPSLPPEMMQQQGAAMPSQANILMAAADLHANGELGDAQQSAPKGPTGTPKVGFPAPHRKNPRHTKSPLG